jgi:hypothetical protein
MISNVDVACGGAGSGGPSAFPVGVVVQCGLSFLRCRDVLLHFRLPLGCSLLDLSGCSEVSRKISPTGERMVIKNYPKDNEPRQLRISAGLAEALSRRVATLGLTRDDLLFPSNGRAGGRPLSRNTFRTRVWLPALERAGLDFHVRFHDLRHAHASWALAGGADLKAVMIAWDTRRFRRPSATSTPFQNRTTKL